jgi:hypothetical protein
MAILAVQSAVRQIARRTRGRRHGPIVRLISPSEFGEILKPFVFVDFLDHDVREPITSGLHPHSGIATVSHLTEGSVNYIDPDNVRGILRAGWSGCRLDAACGTAAVSTLEAACEDSSSGSLCRRILNWGRQ